MQAREVSLGDGAFRRAVLGTIGSVGRALMRPIVRWERRRATIRALSSLDDRMLADIGLSRSEIDQVALGRMPRGGEVIAARFPRRPSPAPEMRKAA